MTTGINAVYQSSTSLTGMTLGTGGTPEGLDTQQSTPPSTNAPPPQTYYLTGTGTQTLALPPNTFTFQRVRLMPMDAIPSTLAKVITTSGGTPVLPGWTQGSVTLPAAPGGNIYMTSAGACALRAEFS
jgi:hypothetical protein